MSAQDNDPRSTEELGKQAVATHKQTTKDTYEALKASA